MLFTRVLDILTFVAQAKVDDLTSGEVAAILGVSTETVTNYADAGRLPHYRLPSGHRRFRRSDVEALLPKSLPRLVAAVCPYHDAPVAEVVPGSDVWCRFCSKWFTVEREAS